MSDFLALKMFTTMMITARRERSTTLTVDRTTASSRLRPNWVDGAMVVADGDTAVVISTGTLNAGM